MASLNYELLTGTYDPSLIEPVGSSLALKFLGGPTDYSTANPTIDLLPELSIEGLLSFIENVSVSGLDKVTYLLKKDGLFYYVVGGAFVVSDGTYGQSSSGLDIYNARAEFTGLETAFNVRVFLHSEDGSTTPQINGLYVEYDDASIKPNATQVRELLEGYGITNKVVSNKWIYSNRDTVVLPHVKNITRMSFGEEKEVTEYYSGNGTPVLILNRRPVNEIVSIRVVGSPEGLGSTYNVALENQTGIIRGFSDMQESSSPYLFSRGDKNIAIRYKYGFVDYPEGVESAIIHFMAVGILTQIESRMGGGNLSVQAHGRTYGDRGKYTNVRRAYAKMAYALLEPYIDAVTGG